MYELNENAASGVLCEPVATYSKQCHMNSLFPDEPVIVSQSDVRVLELFAGVGGFRIGLERASSHYVTVWSNQWEPSTKRQDASILYCRRFGCKGHSNVDINEVGIEEIPDADMLVGGFPCQDYSVATTLKRSGGIEGKKGVLWWQIHRILSHHPSRPKYLMLENVDRLLNSPASQRGRDFAIILTSLSDLGYTVEWRVINAADYGMPQRRRRTYIVAFLDDTPIGKSFSNPESWIKTEGIFAKSFRIKPFETSVIKLELTGSLTGISENFNKGKANSPFRNAGVMRQREIYTVTTEPDYSGPSITLGDILVDDMSVPAEFYINDSDIEKWQRAKGGKTEMRVSKVTGHEYRYSEGAMAFPDSKDKPSRTIITGEGGAAASRFKHVVQTTDGRYRRLVPVELERLNMFPDNHTKGVSDTRRAFLMGNALVTGIVEKIGLELSRRFRPDSERP